MFHEIRRKDRKMEDRDAKEILLQGEYGILSTTSLNGYGYGVPLNYVYFNENIYFHSAMTGHKIDNILENNKASFCVVGEYEPIPDKFTVKYESAIVFGRLIEIEGIEKKEALLGLIKKYSNHFLEKGEKYVNSDIEKTKVIKLTIENICGKFHK